MNKKNLLVEVEHRPILRRLMLPLTGILILLLVGAGMLLYRQHLDQLNHDIATDLADVAGGLRLALDQQARDLATATRLIASEPDVQKTLRVGDPRRLLDTWKPVFDAMCRENQVTHFYFFDTNRVCLLRVHAPEKRGDRINRFTIREAERTGKVASGMELGPLGTFTMRVVQPVFEGGILVGYVELGKEIENVFAAIHIRTQVHVAAVIRKKYLNRQDWEEGMRLLGRHADWDLMPRSVTIFTSWNRLPDVFAGWADQFADEHSPGELDREIIYDQKTWRVFATTLSDSSGVGVGHLLLMRDISNEKKAFAHLIVLSGMCATGILLLLLGFIYSLLRHVDVSIRAQHLKLLTSENQYRELFASSGDALLLINCDTGQIIDANTMAAVLYGYARDELLTLKCTDLSKEPEETTRRMQEARLTSDRVINIPMRLHRKKDGTVFPVEMTARSLIRQGEQAILVSCRDITERKKAEEAINHLTQAKNKFTSVVSHELRSPLATIKEATNLVLEGLLGPLNDEQKDMLNTAKSNIDRLGRLVNDVLTYQKMDAEKMVYNLQENDVNEVVQEAVRSAYLFAGERKADLVIELGEELSKIKFDKDKILQVLFNLLSNALKYSEDGPVVIQTRLDKNEIRFSVRDSGQGIYPEEMDDVFKPFSHGKGRKKGGTGLGLAITKEIVLEHHGRIWVESEVGKGSTFYFTLPV
jgi:PAS domain S-box-containing protein